jgi:hypothetical protein
LLHWTEREGIPIRDLTENLLNPTSCFFLRLRPFFDNLRIL